MAEGVEEAESNSGGDATAMLGAAMPCETIGPIIGGLKREFEAYHSSLASSEPSTPTIPIPSQIQQVQPINLKSEEFEKDRESPLTIMPPSTTCTDTNDNRLNVTTSNVNSGTMVGSLGRLTPEDQQQAVAAAAQAHINGTMQEMLNLQKLQNLASIQHSSLASLQGLSAGISSSTTLNSPLNLSVGSSSNLQPNIQISGSGTQQIGGVSTSQMPQLILASGQLIQGVQGAQLLIPTSQGITTQTILTIPVSQQINSNEQLVQTLAALNNSAASLNQLQSLQISSAQQTSGISNSGLVSPNVFPSSVQQLLAAIHPQIFNQQKQQQSHQLQQQQQHQQQQHQQHQQLHQQLHIQTTPQHSMSPHNNHQQSHQRQSSPTTIHNTRIQTPKSSPPRSCSTSTSSQLSQYEKHQQSISTSQSQQSQLQSSYASHLTNGHVQTTSHHSNNNNRSHSPISTAAINSISRLTSTNGELTITKSHGPPASHCSSNSNSNQQHLSNHHQLQQQTQHASSQQSMKLSPSSMHLSPTGTDTSTADLLSDSPDEPTINQTNLNVVDGIDLDEIKEFAKAFKLRRLSLGLTQTQVGQALSVTEGPAYSQSAICSALAAQMYAAQLSSQQQQNMFEKLDITPKSAQKIKPVLERWMKEAEESHWNRYKSGQNHLTDFIGVEPSKKRKRRTSFTPQALELLNAHFERNTHPSGTEITGMAHQLGYEREVIRIWFCNKRQALKNTVRMMSKGMV